MCINVYLFFKVTYKTCKSKKLYYRKTNGYRRSTLSNQISHNIKFFFFKSVFTVVDLYILEQKHFLPAIYRLLYARFPSKISADRKHYKH